MSYDASIIRAASKQLEARRNAREDQLSHQRSEIYTRIPRMAEIDRQLQQTVISVLSASLRHGKDPSDAVAVARTRNLALQKERKELLLSNGYAIDCLDDVPQCKKCNDSGWIGAAMCDCLKALCAQEQISQLSSLLELGNQSFEAFHLDYYSSEPWPNRPMSPRENMQLVFHICRKYASQFPNGVFTNLFFTGAPGLGKTFLSAAIAREVAQRGFSVVYASAVTIFGQFEAKKFERDQEAGANTRRYLNCDLLILDDLGSELTTNFTQSVLYDILNSRLVSRKHTIISSNLDESQLRALYYPQIVSRILGEYRTLPFYGEDIRQKLANQF